MQKTFKLVIIVMVIFTFHSCIELGIYVSDVPMSLPGSYRSDLSLIGRWEKISDETDGNGSEVIEFIMFNKNEYLIMTRDGGKSSPGRAFITEISGVSFLNLQELSETDRQYVFCKFSINKNDQLTMSFISDTLFESIKPENSKNLRKLIKTHLNNPSLFNKEMKFLFQKILE